MLALNSRSQILDSALANLLDASTNIIVTVGSQLGPYKVEAAGVWRVKCWSRVCF